MGQIRILNPGLMTTVQDLGRYGFQQYGVSVSGAMDQFSARLANILVGNDEHEGILEVTIMGPKIEFLNSEVIAITGGDLQPLINNKPINMNQSILVNSGDCLSFKGLKRGCRSYIAFAGGIDVPIIMGSKSTFLRAKLGGYEGRSLNPGDLIQICKSSSSLSDLEGRKVEKGFYDYSNTVELRVVLGPQDDCFTKEGLETFFKSEYTVTNNCDRMGYTLDGEKIQHKDGADIISDGISMGAIQVPSKGTPIIMMADRQTTGGYTKIANVITVDLPKVAQAKPGDKIVFKKSTLEESHLLINKLEDKITDIKKHINTPKNVEVLNTRSFFLKVNGNPYNVKVEEINS
ncbi:biotin-dependent carboxylase-like uncharacterized protein [Sedimentibacter acidaminivorans]|uniref:Biotin-dependent carboxylase-like uncharacterized protein n=1 Tax=Sedimentibacter acidaminivorans TaxID=913099 RepID=A0ABS4GGI1_9FIRM|nr:biotin-dependent carboxyltransferase family protein [Sedimentibacter acidaminivorans]MBP1926803.1 biotin-dependent carboxylase-like uncharacterized protein [Sedimentibacter acidaminivorans]